MSSNNKMKGLLKGLRYISEIFENEKEPEMEIGMPTDVKHVAHIGVDGPAAAVKSAPSWMNEFKSGPGANNGEVREEELVKATDEVPKSTSSRKSDKPKQSKKGSKSSSSKETSEGTTKHKKKSKDPNQAEDPKKSSRQKKSKEYADGSSRRSRNMDFDNGSEAGSLAEGEP